MPKRRKTKFIITSRFVATPGWEKDYRAGMNIFLRMLERAIKEADKEAVKKASLH